MTDFAPLEPPGRPVREDRLPVASIDRPASHRVHFVIARLNIGGPAIHVSLLASRLRSAYAPVIVTGEVGPHEGDMTYYARECGIEPLVLPGLGRELRLLTDMRLLYQLYRIFRAERPAIVHTHTAKAGTLGRLAARLAGVPVIIHTFHGHVLRGYFGGLRSRLFLSIERWLARLTDQIVVLGELQRREILEMGIGTPETVSVLPLGMDLERLIRLGRRPGALQRRLRLPVETPLVGIVARLVPIKGHRVFLDAARRVAKANPATHFVVVGDGELRGELERSARDLGLADRVHFLGWVHDLCEVYADLDCLVLASLNEGLPTAIIEAQAAAVPVVAARVGSVPELVDHGQTGWLVGPDDAAGLAAATLRVLADPEGARQMGEMAREQVRRFGLDRLLSDTDGLYQRLLSSKGVLS